MITSRMSGTTTMWRCSPDRASVLGNSADAWLLRPACAGDPGCLNRTFFHADTGEYANGTQAANAMALFLNLAPPDQRGAVAKNLTNDITLLPQHPYHDGFHRRQVSDAGAHGHWTLRSGL